MAISFEEALKRAKSKGDLATIFICGSGGFLVDVLSTLHGLISPGYCAGAAATLGLGIKNAVDAGLDRKRASKAAEKRKVDSLGRAERVLAMLEGELDIPNQELIALAKNIRLFRSNLITVEQLEESAERCLGLYRQP